MRFGLIPVIMAACVAVGAAACSSETKQENTGTMQTQASDTGAAAGASETGAAATSSDAGHSDAAGAAANGSDHH